MNLDGKLLVEIVEPVILIPLSIFIKNLLERRPKLISFFGHSSTVSVEVPNRDKIRVNSHSVIVHNTGSRPAHNVRLVHNLLPDFSISPSVQFTTENLGENGKDIIFPILLPGEQITINYLYFPPITYRDINRNIKSDEGFGKVITALPIPQKPKWLDRLIIFLAMCGSISILYLLAEVIRGFF